MARRGVPGAAKPTLAATQRQGAGGSFDAVTDRELDWGETILTAHDTFGKRSVPLSGSQTSAWLVAFDKARADFYRRRRAAALPRVTLELKHDHIVLEGPATLAEGQARRVAEDVQHVIDIANAAGSS
jgi:hypothetical protein